LPAAAQAAGSNEGVDLAGARPEDSAAPKQQAPGLDHGGSKPSPPHPHTARRQHRTPPAAARSAVESRRRPHQAPRGRRRDAAAWVPGSRPGPPPRTRRGPGSSRGPRCARGSLQAGNVGRRQVEALDQEARRLLDAHLGRLLDVGDMTSASSTASTGSWSMASSCGRTRRSTVLSTSVAARGSRRCAAVAMPATTCRPVARRRPGRACGHPSQHYRWVDLAALTASGTWLRPGGRHGPADAALHVAVASRVLVAASPDPGRYFSIASSQIVPCGYVENFRHAALDAALTAATDLRWPPASTASARLPLEGRSASCSPGPGPLADCVSGPQCPAGRHRPPRPSATRWRGLSMRLSGCC
jgi:hypothetical protein